MAKEMVFKSPFDVFAPFAAMPRRWNEMLQGMASEEQGRMIVPALDIAETEAEFTLSTELPGLKKEDVKITFEKGVLTISGEKKLAREEKKQDYHCVERRYGSFLRTVKLPIEVDVDKATAGFEDGVLTITVPKVEAAKPHELKIG